MWKCFKEAVTLGAYAVIVHVKPGSYFLICKSFGAIKSILARLVRLAGRDLLLEKVVKIFFMSSARTEIVLIIFFRIMVIIYYM